MKDKKTLGSIALILSLIGFATGFIIIGMILDIISIIMAAIAIRDKDKNTKYACLAIPIAMAGFVLTSIVFTSSAAERKNAELTETVSQVQTISETSVSETSTISEMSISEASVSETSVSETSTEVSENISEAEVYEYDGVSYQILDVDGGDTSGSRKPNVAVDVGFGERIYWGLTNEYGQLAYVIADEIVLQDDEKEPVNADGRYFDNEADVPGTEKENFDQGHVIADSLGGVANAYNITPQDSTLNRHGDQAYMEEVIRQANGCKEFVATITYPDTKTQIPSHYHYEYILNGEKVTDDFDNVNPEPVKEETKAEETEAPVAQAVVPAPATEPAPAPVVSEQTELARIDTDGNGQVTIKEAKAAGFAMPINSSHWLYKYMIDKDGDGQVGE